MVWCLPRGACGRRICEWWVASPRFQIIIFILSAVSIVSSMFACADLLPWWFLLLLVFTFVPVSSFIGLTLQVELFALLAFRFEDSRPSSDTYSSFKLLLDSLGPLVATKRWLQYQRFLGSSSCFSSMQWDLEGELQLPNLVLH
jgi:hypothetical protein